MLQALPPRALMVQLDSVDNSPKSRFGLPDTPHAVVDAARPQAPLGNLEAASFWKGVCIGLLGAMVACVVMVVVLVVVVVVLDYPPQAAC